MFFFAWRRTKHLGRGAQLRLGRLAIGLSHFGRQPDYSRGEADVIRPRSAFFVEFGRLGFRIEGARCHFNDAGPDGHAGIIAFGAARRHPVATVMKPQTPNGVYRS